MDAPIRRENSENRVFKKPENPDAHLKKLDSDGYSDQARDWKFTLDERIIEQDNAKKRSQGKIPIVSINSNPPYVPDPREDVSDAEIADDGKPLPKRKRRR
jgi:hypothetical protein